MTSLCALLPDNEEHHLDHLAPLASILEVPLVVTDPEIASLAERYYPRLTLMHISSLEMPFMVLENFDAAITCLPYPLLRPHFYVAELELQKPLQTFWLPHGHSDKGRKVPFFEGLQDEKALFIYGPAMERRIGEVLKEPPPMTSLGNFRAAYHRQYASYYEEILQREIRPHLTRQRVFLYAPTWNDAENSSSLEEGMMPLLGALPEDVTLLVKVHPHSRMNEILERVRGHEGVVLLERFPPIYALLSLVDTYIGDLSSIGYDFLTFDRPLILLMKEKRELPLSACAHTLSLEEAHLAFSLEDNPLHRAARQILYEDAFGCKTV